MAAINFCDGNMGTRITCDKVYCDGYSPENLLQQQTLSVYGGGNKGFLAESYIKPPINLTLHFPCNIDIEKISVCGKEGRQRSRGVEIFVANDNVKAQSLQEVLNADLSSLKQYVSELRFSSAGALYADEQEDLFIFRNYNFKASPPLVNLKKGQSRLCSLVCKERSLIGRVSSVSHIVVRITKSVIGCVAAVGWLEVWAQPSRTCPAGITKEIIQVHSSMFNQADPSGQSKPKNTVDDTANKPKLHESVEKDVDIPADFLDALTNHLMSLPVMLPSSHSIDQTSLDRHNAQEAVWGRPPSDPFTGLRYTSTRKPLPHSTLKLRIDQFLLKHRDVPGARTVGTVSASTHASSRLVSSTATTTELCKEANQQMLSSKTDLRPSSSTTSSISLKRKIDDNCVQSISKKVAIPGSSNKFNNFVHTQTVNMSRHVINDNNSKKCVLNTADNKSPVQSKPSKISAVLEPPVIDLCEDEDGDSAIVIHNLSSDSDGDNGADNLQHSVDNALEQALDGLPSYTRSTNTDNIVDSDQHRTSDTVVACQGCNCELSQGQAAYKGPCQHILCRKCITESTKSGHVTCPHCKATAVTREFIKIHQMSRFFHH